MYQLSPKTISIHALLAESDRSANCSCHSVPPISIHALLAESDGSGPAWLASCLNFYPRSPCGERLHYDNYNLHCVEISIHALLAESDNAVMVQADIVIGRISIHALLAESDFLSLRLPK